LETSGEDVTYAFRPASGAECPQENPMLDLDTILVKERVGLMKLADTYDLYDPSTGVSVGICQEAPAWWAHLLRTVVDKRMLPTRVVVTDTSGETILDIRRGFTLLFPTIRVLDGRGNQLGSLKAKFFAIGTSFRVFNVVGNEIATVKGDWKGWNFKLLSSAGAELGTITKKWAGLGKELFTSADNYVISLAPDATGKSGSRKMLLAAALAIDTCFKENK